MVYNNAPCQHNSLSREKRDVSVHETLARAHRTVEIRARHYTMSYPLVLQSVINLVAKPSANLTQVSACSQARKRADTLAPWDQQHPETRLRLKPGYRGNKRLWRPHGRGQMTFRDGRVSRKNEANPPRRLEVEARLAMIAFSYHLTCMFAGCSGIRWRVAERSTSWSRVYALRHRQPLFRGMEIGQKTRTGDYDLP